MNSGENEREEASPPDGDGMNLLIGWRAGGKKAAGAPATSADAYGNSLIVVPANTRWASRSVASPE